jgi:hypothetical protein
MRRLFLQGLVVIGLGAIGLASPRQADAAVAKMFSGCGVCWSSSTCPDPGTQDSWCGSLCGGGWVHEADSCNTSAGNEGCTDSFYPIGWNCRAP